MKLLLRYVLVLTLLALAGCGSPLSTVYLKTTPPGKMVQVAETGTVVPDGGKIHLPRGSYHFNPYQVPESPGSVIVTVDGIRDESVIVPTGPEELLSRFQINTIPAGGMVLVVETNRTVADGGMLSLPGGRYTLRPSKPGYRPRDVILDVKENTEEDLVIHLGTGFAELSLQSEPAGADVMIGGKSLGQTPLGVELAEGTYRVDLTLDGYHAAAQSVLIIPGEATELKQTLQPLPTSGTVKVSTEPSGGEIFFRGKTAGVGQVDLGRLPFGSYTVQGYKTIDGQSRLSGRQSVNVEQDRLYQVKLSLNDKERKLTGKWLPEAEALRLERDRYRGQRVANPVLAEVLIDRKNLKSLGAANSFAKNLHAILRVGDRVDVTSNGSTWEFWKRNATPEPEFLAMASALFNGSAMKLPWASETTTHKVKVAQAERPLAELAFALHRVRSPLPLLDLSAQQLAESGETVQRCREDGALTVLVEADAAPQLSVKPQAVGENLWLANLTPADAPESITWSVVPDRLLVVGDAANLFAARIPDAELLINEKQIVKVAPGAKVERLVRISGGPDYEGWPRQEFVSSGPLAGQIDLSQDEIGPNERFGAYQRIWLIDFLQGGQVTQRQVAARYQVVDQKKDFGSEKFLRRGSLPN